MSIGLMCHTINGQTKVGRFLVFVISNILLNEGLKGYLYSIFHYIVKEISTQKGWSLLIFIKSNKVYLSIDKLSVYKWV